MLYSRLTNNPTHTTVVLVTGGTTVKLPPDNRKSIGANQGARTFEHDKPVYQKSNFEYLQKYRSCVSFVDKYMYRQESEHSIAKGQVYEEERRQHE